MAKRFSQGLGKTAVWPAISGVNPMQLSYDDVLLVPQNSSISSRSEVNTSIQFGPYPLSVPVVSAPMDTISGKEMIIELARLGAIGTLPRGDLEKRLLICEELSAKNIPCVYAIGKNGFDEAKQLKERGAKIILIDVAHGGMDIVTTLAVKIKKTLRLMVIAGNIATYTQAQAYKAHGIDFARVGIGPGGLCTTRLVAGCGIPQLSAIFDTTSADIPVIADGGVHYPGDIAKAIAAGASIIMIGSLLAGVKETPGEVDENNTKVVRGQASAAFMKDNDVQVSALRGAEGISTRVLAKGTAAEVVNTLQAGLRSAMSYTGAKTIREFQKKAQFVLVSQAAQKESHPHILHNRA